VPAVILFFALDSTSNILMGVIKGVGLQGQAAAVGVCSSVVISLPLMYLCAFVWELDAPGLWLGISGGMAFQCFCFVAILKRSNWK
jgi:multidrug resistance protein, MATE family